MTALATKPAALAQSTAEDITWGVDVTAQLTTGQTVTFPVVTLRSKTGAPVALVDVATVAGNVVRQRIRAGVLTRGTWTLHVLHTPSGTTNILESVLTIVSP